ncbi:PIN domain nuclease [bacterium]|nr:PIN domain nuclease [bacterium]RQV95075.1 MAG: PIN domain nuclease [bacterium]
MIFVDTSVWIDYFNGEITWQTDYLDSILDKESVAIGDLVLTEVLQGFRSDKDFKQALELFSPFPFFDMLGRDLAVQSAKNFRFLKKRGLTVRKTMDVMIATFCLACQLPLLHDDQDFNPMESHLNLQVIKPGRAI